MLMKFMGRQHSETHNSGTVDINVIIDYLYNGNYINKLTACDILEKMITLGITKNSYDLERTIAETKYNLTAMDIPSDARGVFCVRIMSGQDIGKLFINKTNNWEETEYAMSQSDVALQCVLFIQIPYYSSDNDYNAWANWLTQFLQYKKQRNLFDVNDNDIQDLVQAVVEMIQNQRIDVIVFSPDFFSSANFFTNNFDNQYLDTSTMNVPNTRNGTGLFENFFETKPLPKQPFQKQSGIDKSTPHAVPYNFNSLVPNTGAKIHAKPLKQGQMGLNPKRRNRVTGQKIWNILTKGKSDDKR